jgi:predicted Zn-dependent protease
MKSNYISKAAIVALFLAPMTFAQVTTNPQNTPQVSTQTTTPDGKPQVKIPQDIPQTKDDKDQTDKPAKTSEPVDNSKAKATNSGGKDDVEAIGNRKGVGGRGLGDWYSIDSEIKMGKMYAQQVEQTVKLVQDPVVNEYVNRVGQNIVRNSDCKVPFTIKVVDSDEINAFALPGGFFYVNSGLILAADEESELAGVMAHETAHVCARHAMRQQTRSNWANIASLPLIFVGGGIGYAARSVAQIGLPLTFMSFSRTFEAEADYLGMQYSYATGYDPQASISFFEKIEAQEKKKPGAIAKAFASHPATPDRISNLQKEIATILPSKEQYLVTTSEFDDVKTRLAALENRRKVTDSKDDNKPTLRRTAQTDKDKTSDKDKSDKSDDDRPTLKRRDNN